MMCREKPNIVKDRETERALQRIATRYLFFNMRPCLTFFGAHVIPDPCVYLPAQGGGAVV